MSAIAIAGVAAFATGCAEEAEYSAPQYPEAPVGYDTQAEQAQYAAQTNGADQEAIARAQGRTNEYGEVDIGAAPDAQQVADVQTDDYEETDPSALTDFHDTLDPYGTWVDDPTYGTVWVPSSTVVGDDFTPYVTAGHWTYDDDYVWASDYSWGWAPFHYGRWTYIGGRGWGWVPGRVYAGAWVSWRYGYDDYAYVGWAPMPPTWYWRGGYAYGLGVVPYASFGFCARGDLFHPVVAGRMVRGAQVGVIASHTRPFVATPGVGGVGRVGAHPGVGGPSPNMLHIPANQVAHAAPSNAGLNHARAFAHPSTATGLGAHPPQGMSHGAQGATTARNFGHTSPSVGGVSRGYTYNGPSRAMPYHAPSSGYSRSYGGTSRSFGGGGYSPPVYHAPPAYHSYGGSPSFHSQGPTFHSPGPTYHTPTYRSGGSSGGRRGSSGGGSVYHGSSGGFRGGGFSRGGGGGFHGGGGGGRHR